MKLAIFMFASLLMTGAASPQPKQSAPRKTRPKVTAAFSTVPFDGSVERLPQNYGGHSMINVWPELNKRRLQLKQGEYETKEVWAERLQKLQDQPLTGSLTVLSQLAFLATDFENAYDADAK